jgi:hypothetical protein
MREKWLDKQRALRLEKAIFGGQKPFFFTFALIIALNY